jgi:hypothetical protein
VLVAATCAGFTPMTVQRASDGASK